jgi:hypothetical protein
MNLESKDIHVIDHFLNVHENQFIAEFFNGKDAKWVYGHNSLPGDAIKWFKWVLDDDQFFNDYLLTKISEITNCNWDIRTVYANGQTILLDGSWHQDITGKNVDEDYWTALLYVSDITPDNVDIINGHTDFKIDEKIQSIEPYKNRLVLFKSDIFHKGRAPSIPSMLRTSIAWKLKKRR